MSSLLDYALRLSRKARPACLPAMTDDEPPKMNAGPLRMAAERLREEAANLDRLADQLERGELVRYAERDMDPRIRQALERLRGERKKRR